MKTPEARPEPSVRGGSDLALWDEIIPGIRSELERHAFDPSQPRDDDGKWTSGSGGGEGGGGGSAPGDEVRLEEGGHMASLQAVSGAPVRVARDDDPRLEDSVPAFYDESERAVYVRKEHIKDEPVIAHELGHAMDHKLGGDPQSHFTDTTDWSSALRADQKAMGAWDKRTVGRGTYFGQRGEAFSELVALVMSGRGSAISATRLKGAFPNSLAVVRAQLERQGVKIP